MDNTDNKVEMVPCRNCGHPMPADAPVHDCGGTPARPRKRPTPAELGKCGNCGHPIGGEDFACGRCGSGTGRLAPEEVTIEVDEGDIADEGPPGGRLDWPLGWED